MLVSSVLVKVGLLVLIMEVRMVWLEYLIMNWILVVFLWFWVSSLKG